MKKWTSKLLAAVLAVVMVVTSFTPTALAAPKSESKAAVSDELVLSDNTKDILKAAKAMAAYSELAKVETETSAEKDAVKDAIFHNYNEETDLSDLGISAKEMDKITEEVLEENNMEDSVEVTYETDAAGDVTTVSVDMDSMLVNAAAEVAAATGLTQAEKDDIVARYAAYQQSMISMTDPSTGQETNVQDLFGVQAPYFTSKDTAACPIGSLLSIAGIPNSVLEYGLEAIVANGIMDYATITGILDLFTYANQFAVMMKGEEMGTAIESALGSIPSGADTTEEILLHINDWLAQNCTFDMPYIMEMTSPEEDTTSEIAQDRQAIYTQMYDNIKGMVYQQVYDQVYPMVYDQVYNQVYETVYNLTLVNTDDEATAAAAAEAEAKPQAEAYAQSEADTYAAGYAAQYMDAPTEDGSDNGATSAMTLATSIINLWEGNHVGALTYGTAVCLGYSNAYTLLVQHAFENVYKKNGAWRSYEELNKGSAGSWEAMVDYVRISFDTEVTMFGVTQDNFTSDHYWNAVKVNGKWYYVDPCYTDVYVEVMARDRVETNGNMNHLYFLFSHDAAEELYDGYYSLIDTAYKGVATDRTYEESWVAYAKSPMFVNNGYYYYMYDSTDLINMQSDDFQNESSNNYSDMESMLDSTEYKVVRRSASKSPSAKDGYETLVEFPYSESLGADNDGDGSTDMQSHGAQVYNPKTKAMEDDALVQELYEKHKELKEDYPSIIITVAFYNGKVYFNLANCILTYDTSTGAVERVYEYNEVYGERDMQKAFGGMAFTTTTSSNADVSVKNPPIAGFTIKDGTMYVDLATTLGFISGKDRDNMDDPSNYGYEFEETNYNDEYMYASYSDMGSMMGDTTNDNDEFMWSANIVDTVDLKCSHSYSNVSVDETCTTAAFTESRCSKCGFVQSSGMKDTTLKFQVVDTNGNSVNKTIESIVTNTLERNFSASAFTYEKAKAAVEAVLGTEYLAIEMPETIAWSETKTATVVVASEEVKEDVTANPSVAVEVNYVVEGHTHTDACKGLTCTKEEHAHVDACKSLTCTDTTEGHVHADACYTLTCTKEEHAHTDACEGNTCGKTEAADETVGTATVKRNVAKATDTEYTFDADEIVAYIPEGYKVSGTVADVKVQVNTSSTTSTTTTTVKVVADEDTANLQVIVKAGELELASALLSNTTGTADGVTFTAEQIKSVIPTGYEATAEVSAKTVAFGKKEVVTVSVEEVKGTATLTIKATDASDVPLTKEGLKGDTAVFTAAEILEKVTVKEGYAITSIVSDRAVVYGESATINVTIASTAEAAEGHGHKYVEFKETYYTRRDEDNPDSAFNTGTSYVCIHCKDAVDSKPSEMYSLSNKNLTNVWTWSLDLTSASLYEIPTELKDVLLDCVWENSGLGSKRTIATVEGPVQSGTCTSGNGLNFKFTATANGKTDSQSYNVKYDNHLYTDATVSYAWAADNSACTVSHTCVRCNTAGTTNATVEKRDVVASCVDDASTIYTAKVELGGVPFSNQVVVPTGEKAYGHNYDSKHNICKNCGKEKPESYVSLPSTIKVSYTGKAAAAINGVKEATIVEGSTGATSRTYYSDKACTKKVTTATGASKAGYAPTKMGIYYVKVKVKADKDYKAATSNVCKVVIAPKQTTISAYNSASGIYLYWDKVGHADGYRIYRREQGGTYERVYSTSKNTTLKWTDKNAKVGTNYEYDVRPYKKVSGTTIYAITRTDDARKAARTKLTSSNTRSGLKLSWNKVYNATGYTVWRKASTADSFTKIATIKNGSTTTYTDSRAKNGTKYTYYVRPTGNVTVRTNKVTKLYLAATEINKISSPKAVQVKVTWDKNAKADGYQVRYSTSSSFSSYKTVKVTSKSTLNTTISGLTKGKTYYVKVRSYKKSGDTTYYSAWTEVSSVKTKK